MGSRIRSYYKYIYTWRELSSFFDSKKQKNKTFCVVTTSFNIFKLVGFCLAFPV